MFRSLFKSSFVAIAATATTLAVGGAANAAILFTDTDSFTGQLTELEGSPLLTLNKYNGPGTVTQVTVSFDGGSLTSSGNVTNNAPNAQSFSLRTNAEQFDLDPAETAPVALNSFSLAIGQVIGNQSYTNLASGATATFGSFTLNLDPESQVFNGGLISQFLGAGTFDFEPTTLISQTFVGGGGNVAADLTTFAAASVTITYEGQEAPPTQVPVPPAFAGMLAFGALGAWKVRRRNQATSEA